MAIRYAVANGNWSSPSTWDGLTTIPTSADDVYANTRTVTIDISPTVLSVQNGTATGVTTAGGTFVPTNGITLTCTGAGVVGVSGGCFTFNLISGQSCSIVGTCIGAGAYSVNATGNGALNITGNVAGGAVATSNGIFIGSSNSPTITITGNVTGNSGTGIQIQNAIGSNLILFIVGNCIAIGAQAVSVGSVGITATISGTMTPANNIAAFEASSFGTYIFSGPFAVSTNGTHAVFCRKWFWANSNVTPTYYQIRTQNLATIRPLYTADSVGGNPATSNVRSGTVFGPASELTGTLAVPPAGSVALGVPVDNTTGTAYLSQSDIATAATTALTAASAVTLNQQITTLTTPGSIGERMKTSATVATVSQQLSDALSSRV